jgi:hypothetical protein
LIRKDLTVTAIPIPLFTHENESRSMTMSTTEQLGGDACNPAIL